MNFINEAGRDRIGRVAIGIALLVLGFGGIVEGGLGTAFKVAGSTPS